MNCKVYISLSSFSTGKIDIALFFAQFERYVPSFVVINNKLSHHKSIIMNDRMTSVLPVCDWKLSEEVKQYQHVLLQSSAK